MIHICIRILLSQVLYVIYILSDLQPFSFHFTFPVPWIVLLIIITDPSDVVPVALKPFNRPALITFDAMDTLIEPSQSVGRWYREALNSLGDMRLRLPRPALFTAAFNKAFSDMCKANPCFGAKTGMSARDWWYEVVRVTFLTTEGVDTQVDSDEMEAIMPELFDIIYETVR